MSMVIGSKIVIYSDEIIIEPKKMLERLWQDETTILELVPSYADAWLLIWSRGQKNERIYFVSGKTGKTALLY